MSTTTDNLDFDDPASVDRLSVRGLARNGAIAGGIKLASAGLSFLMFVVVALVTDERQFGLFSAAYAGASLVSFFNTLGQQSAVLRFWPEHSSSGNLPTAHSFMARSLLVAGAGALASVLLVCAIGLLPWFQAATPEWMSLCFGAAVLAAGLGWSEVTSGALRAKGVLIAGLLPRDVIWRVLIIAVAATLWWLHIEVPGSTAMYLTGGLLLLAVLPQSIRLIRETARADRTPLTAGQLTEFRSVTSGLWGITSVPPALAQISTLMVAGILGPEAAGAVFVAERTTRLINIALNGINQALAPEISSGFHSGDIAFVRRLSHLTALGASLVAVSVFIVFGLFGKEVLAIFEPSYATPTMHAVLLTFCIGTSVACASGPVEVLMQVTGGQHQLLRILAIVNPIGLLAIAVFTFMFGPIGAAASIAGTVAIWNVLGAISLSRRIDIDPSLLGLFRRWSRLSK